MIAQKPLILVTNDDGITAPGIRKLIQIMSEIGEVIVVAPDKPQSAMGHAITINNTLHLNKISSPEAAAQEYSCSGTPVDCVKIAVNELLERKPDLCVSGINHGSNAAINVIYSGTMSAAIEAGIEEIPAIGFSLLNYDWNANFDNAAVYIKKIALLVLQKKFSKGIILNVNIPNLDTNLLRGIKICRQANAFWIEKFDKRTTPFGKDYYWLTGTFVNEDTDENTDQWALENNYISVVPVQFDLTNYAIKKEIENWQWND